MKILLTILLLVAFLSSQAQNVNQSQVRQFNSVPAYRVFGRGSGVGSPSFIQLDSNHIPPLHSQGYYDGRYQPLGSFITGGSITWPSTIYSSPTTGTATSGSLNFAPTLANQSAYSVFARGSGTGTPSFISSLDSNFIPSLHSKGYYDAIYPAVSFGKNATRDSTVIVFANGLRYASKDSVGASGGGSQWTTVNASDIYYNTGNVGIGSVNAPTAKLSITNDNLGGTTPSNTSGIALENNTAATSTVQQWSPAIRFRAQGWKTTATAASQPLDWKMYATTSSGTTASQGGINFDVSSNGGATTTPMQISSSGTLTVSSTVNAPNLSSSSGITANGTFTLTKNVVTASGGNSFMLFPASGATSGVPVQYSPAIRWQGNGWDGSANNFISVSSEMRPITATPARGNMVFSSGVSTSSIFSGTDRFGITTDGGVVIYPMTKAQRDAIASPQQGRVVFVSDNGGYLSYYNAGWFKVSSVAD